MSLLLLFCPLDLINLVIVQDYAQLTLSIISVLLILSWYLCSLITLWLGSKYQERLIFVVVCMGAFTPMFEMIIGVISTLFWRYISVISSANLFSFLFFLYALLVKRIGVSDVSSYMIALCKLLVCTFSIKHFFYIFELSVINVSYVYKPPSSLFSTNCEFLNCYVNVSIPFSSISLHLTIPNEYVDVFLSRFVRIESYRRGI